MASFMTCTVTSQIRHREPHEFYFLQAVTQATQILKEASAVHKAIGHVRSGRDTDDVNAMASRTSGFAAYVRQVPRPRNSMNSTKSAQGHRRNCRPCACFLHLCTSCRHDVRSVSGNPSAGSSYSTFLPLLLRSQIPVVGSPHDEEAALLGCYPCIIVSSLSSHDGCRSRGQQRRRSLLFRAHV